MKRVLKVLPYILVAVFILLWLFILPYGSFGDEHENFTAGWLISQGLLPYRDFFFHHAPLPFFAAAPFFFVSDTPWLAIRSLVLLTWLVCTAVVFRYLSHPTRTSWGIFLVIAALTAPSLLGHFYLAESIITSLLATVVFFAAENSTSKRLIRAVPFPTALKLLLMLSGTLVWTTVVTIPAVIVIWIGVLYAYLSREMPSTLITQLKSQSMSLVSSLVLAAVSIPLIFFFFGAAGDLWWGTISYNTDYYFAARLAHTITQLEHGYAYAVIESFTTATGTAITEASVHTLRALQTAATLLEQSLTGTPISHEHWKVLGTEWYNHAVTLDQLITLCVLSVAAALVLTKRWVSLGFLICFSIAVRARDNEMFKLAPYYLSALAAQVFLIQTVLAKKKYVLAAALMLIPILWLSRVTSHYVDLFSSKQPLFTQRALTTAQVLASQSSQTLLCICQDPSYYLLAQKLPSTRYMYYHPWFAVAPPIANELAEYLQTNTSDPVILESELVGNDLSFASPLIEILSERYQRQAPGVYFPTDAQ